MKGTIFFSAKASLSFITLASVLYYVFAGQVIALFMRNEAIIAYGSRFLRGFCLGLPFLCMDFLAVGVFQACGMGRKSLVFAILRKIILEIPALYILNWLFPLYGLAFSQFAAEVVLAAAATVVLLRMFRQLEQKLSLIHI